MRIQKRSIWDKTFDPPVLRVIPVNVGWKRNGESVMGRGIAREAAERYPELLLWWGSYCQAHVNRRDSLFTVYDDKHLILFPTKPLDRETPYLSWRQPSDLGLIKEGFEWLSRLCFATSQKIVLPLVGCGNGGLNAEVVLSLMLEYFEHDDDVVLVVR